MFATAEEAALAVARFLARSQEASGEKAPRAAAPAAAPVASRAAPMSAAECHAAAAAEGLWLVPADNATAFKGVHPNSGSFRGALWRDGSSFTSASLRRRRRRRSPSRARSDPMGSPSRQRRWRRR